MDHPGAFYLWGTGDARYDMAAMHAGTNIAPLKAANPNMILLMTGNSAISNAPSHVSYGSNSFEGWGGGADTISDGAAGNAGSIRAFNSTWDKLYNANGTQAGIDGGGSGHLGWNLANYGLSIGIENTWQTLARFILYRLKQQGLYAQNWDGYHSDNWFNSITAGWFYGANLDSDRNGSVDAANTIKQRWGDGLAALAQYLSQNLPGKSVGGNGILKADPRLGTWAGTHTDKNGWRKHANWTMIEDGALHLYSHSSAQAIIDACASSSTGIDPTTGSSLTGWTNWADQYGRTRRGVFMFELSNDAGNTIATPSGFNNPATYKQETYYRPARKCIAMGAICGFYSWPLFSQQHDSRLFYDDEYRGGTDINARGWMGEPVTAPVSPATNVFYRTFENGMAVVNVGGSPITFNMPSGSWRLIDGTASHNTGAAIGSTFQIPAHDGRLFVRTGTSPPPPPPPPPVSNVAPYFMSDAERTTIVANLGVSPYSGAWANEQALANGYLSYSPNPPDPNGNYGANWNAGLYQPGIADGHAAHSLAFAYLMTGTTSYANRAMLILRSWRDNFTHPPGGVGHMVAEPKGWAIKMFMAIDMLGAFMGQAEKAQFANWASQWINSGQSAADQARDSPWLPDVTINATNYAYVPTGNSPSGQMAMAAWAAALTGGSTLDDAIDWCFSHTTPGGLNYGWDFILDNMVVAAHSGGTHSGAAAKGETVEGHERESVFYGTFAWFDLVLIADLAMRIGFQHDLYTRVTPVRGRSLTDICEFYSPYLQQSSPAAIQAFYAQTGGDGAVNSSIPAQRSQWEYLYKNIDSGHARFSDIEDAVTFGGNSVRDDNRQIHLLRFTPTVMASASFSTPVPSGNPPVNVTDPTITGTAQEGEVLTASIGTWTDADEFVTEWVLYASNGTTRLSVLQSNDFPYTVTGADIGFRIRLEVTASNVDGDTQEISTATAVVTAAPEDDTPRLDGPPSAISDFTITATPLVSVTFPWSAISDMLLGEGRGRLTTIVRVTGVRGAGSRPSGLGGGGI